MAPKKATKAKGKAKAAAKPKQYDYSGLEKGMKLQAEIGGAYYSAEVVQVSKAKKWAKTPVLVHWQGYKADTDEWVSGDRLKSKALKEKKEPKKEKKPKKEGEEGEKKPRGTAVLRLLSYKCKAGKEKEFKDLIDELAKDVVNIEGLSVFDWTWPDPSTFSAAMLFKSQEMLDKYKSGVREKYLARMGPMLDGPPKYDTSGPLSRTYRNRKAQPEEGKAVMRLVAYGCKEGKEEEWKKHMDGMLMKKWPKEVEGYTVCRYGWADEKTIIAAMCFESMEALDKYKTGVREKYIEEMKELLGASPFDELGTNPESISPPPKEKYFPKTVADAWKNHFDAFGAQDLEKIMLDYDDNSIARLYNNEGEIKSEFKGASEIKGMFESLFKDLKDLKTLKAPVIDIEEDARQVFLVWMCPGCGYDTATDTFIFRKVRGQFKISRQNIVITKK